MNFEREHELMMMLQMIESRVEKLLQEHIQMTKQLLADMEAMKMLTRACSNYCFTELENETECEMPEDFKEWESSYHAEAD